ncbi:TPA: hypothetical protein SAK09_000910 [Campylobacter coli]|nr:hypothetical protein [Campylobacter coli]
MNFRYAHINNLYKNTSLKILNYEDEYDFINDEFIFFTYLNMIPTFLQRFQKLENAKVFIINFHVSSWNIFFSHLNEKRIAYRKNLIELFYKTNSLIFMDDACCHQSSEMLDKAFPEHYVPVFSKPKILKKEKTITTFINENEINIAYLGRLDNDKIFVLLNLLEILDNIELVDKKIVLHIIGDGNSTHLINFQKYKNIKIFFRSFLENEELEKYINDKVDLGIALGMASLEFAKEGIPTIIPPFVDKDIPFDKFIWLNECDKKTLGADINSITKLGLNFYSLQELLEDFIAPNKKQELSELVYQYFKNNYHINTSANLFLTYILQTNLKISDFLKIKKIKNFICNANFARKHHYDMNDFLKLQNKKNLPPFLFKIFFIKKLLTDNLKKDIELNSIETYTKNTYSLFGLTTIKTYLSNSFYIIKYFGFNIYRTKTNKTSKKYYFSKIKLLEKINSGNELKIILFHFIPIYRNKKSYDNYYLAIQRHYETVRQNIKHNITRNQSKVRVGFYTMGVFSYESLYKAMEKSDFFEPFILIIPDVSRSDRTENISQESYERFKSNYSNVFLGYDSKTKTFFDYSDKMDIVFFDNPYPAMAHKYHFIDYFLNKNILTCFQNYGFFTLKYGLDYIAKKPFYNMCWKVFVDSYETYNELKIHQSLKAKNTFVSGYCKMDNLANFNQKKKERKRILLCPHHTINMKALQISNFLKYSDFFLELPKLFPQIDFIFRPHILLFWTLKHYWGEEKTNKYLEDMKNNSNVIYDDNMSYYFQSFADSDAIIHDCGSFTAEYLFTGKPACYMLMQEDDISNKFLNIGQKCLENYYHAFNEKDIINFIQDVVIDENDTLKESRELFSKYLKINYPFVGETILKYIQDEILK